MKTNFDVITENATILGNFMDKLDKELTERGNICKYCGQYLELEEPKCYTKCSKGFKMWLEMESDINE